MFVRVLGDDTIASSGQFSNRAPLLLNLPKIGKIYIYIYHSLLL